MATRIQIRRGTAAEWASANPILAQGELGAELDTDSIKVGDGTTDWNSLGYVTGGAGPQGATGTQGRQGIQGYGWQGTQGAFGRQGIVGPQGEGGTQGLQGVFGTQGFQGKDGTAQGTQGLQGLQGIGSQGFQGADGTGSQGAQGTQGAFGLQGTQGVQGTQGIQGVQGSQGTAIRFLGTVSTKTLLPGYPNSYLGAVGDSYTTLDISEFWYWNGSAWVSGGQISGAQGVRGRQGFTGTQGAQGIQGIQGVQGEDGAYASQGVQGRQGVQGTQGTQGTQGSQGAQGAQGTQGEDGAYASIGVQGNLGIQGIQGVGAQGTQGTQGLRGDFAGQGIQGSQGSQGTQGTQGAFGLQGTQGIQGVTGNFGGASFNYLFKSTLTGDPGPGFLLFDRTTFGLATSLNIDDQDVNNDDIQSYLRTIDDSTSTIKGHFRISLRDDPSDYALFTISGLTEQGGYFTIDCDFISGTRNSLSNNDDIIITFARTGDKGEIGTQGTQGIQGLQGTQGTQGVQGPQGTQGLQGTQGTQGEDGAFASQGIQGTQGTQGLQGPQGTQGTQGLQGIQGTAGYIGEDGAQGRQGIQGSQGPQGLQGTQGTQGSAGYVGEDGSQGAQGTQGTDGAYASIGLQGLQGTQGTQGLQGSQGLHGEFAGQGVQGGQGIQGIAAQGSVGDLGAQGRQGIQGVQGPQGVQGLHGEFAGQGVQGTTGIQGPADGPQGAAGAQGSGTYFSKNTDIFTATEGQTSFSVTYNSGYIDVYLNGVLLAETEYTATDGTSVVLNNPVSAGSKLIVLSYSESGVQGIQGLDGTGFQGLDGAFAGQGVQGTQGVQGRATFFRRDITSITATSGQTIFNVTYVVGYLDVFVTGVLLDPSDYTATNSSTVTLNDPVSEGTVLNFVAYQESGAQGRQGIQGLQGTQGTQGLQGLQGTQGTQGTQGLQGLQGTQGTQGLQGTQGTQGTQGLQGTQGEDGAFAGQGVQGTQGVQGLQGSGLQGLDGAFAGQGVQGTQGPQGLQGLQGPQGTQGTQGIQGVQGLDGLFAGQGATGRQGLDGAFAGQGVQGTQGPLGIQGTTEFFSRNVSVVSATNGQDTFYVTYNIGFIEIFVNGSKLNPTEYIANNGTTVVLAEAVGDNTQIEFITYSQAGPQGIQGPQGSQGLDGEYAGQGIQGPQGVQGEIGIQGPADGPQGIQGRQGIQGILGGFSGLVFDYTYSNNTTASDPGSGTVKANAISLSTISSIYLDDTDGAGTNLDTFIQSLLSNSPFFYIRIFERLNPEIYGLYRASSMTDNGGWYNIPVTHVSSSATNFNVSDVLVSFAFGNGLQGPQGVQGVQGETGTSTFNPIQVASDGGTVLSGDNLVATGSEALEFVAGNGIQLVTDPSATPKSLKINATFSDFSVSNDNTSSSVFYPVIVNATSGIPSQIRVSSYGLSYRPDTGTLNAKGFVSTSDITKKKNIRTIDNALDIVDSLDGVRFDWIDNNTPSLGLIAQNVEQVLPELVEILPDGTKAVSYGNIIGVLIEAIKQQQTQINELREN